MNKEELTDLYRQKITEYMVDRNQTKLKLRDRSFMEQVKYLMSIDTYINAIVFYSQFQSPVSVILALNPNKEGRITFAERIRFAYLNPDKADIDTFSLDMQNMRRLTALGSIVKMTEETNKKWLKVLVKMKIYERVYTDRYDMYDALIVNLEDVKKMYGSKMAETAYHLIDSIQLHPDELPRAAHYLHQGGEIEKLQMLSEAQIFVNGPDDDGYFIKSKEEIEDMIKEQEKGIQTYE